MSPHSLEWSRFTGMGLDSNDRRPFPDVALHTHLLPTPGDPAKMRLDSGCHFCDLQESNVFFDDNKCISDALKIGMV